MINRSNKKNEILFKIFSRSKNYRKNDKLETFYIRIISDLLHFQNKRVKKGNGVE